MRRDRRDPRSELKEFSPAIKQLAEAYDSRDRTARRAALKLKWERRLIRLLLTIVDFLAGMAFCHWLNLGVS